MNSGRRQRSYCLGRALGSLGRLGRRRGPLAGLAGGWVILHAIHGRGSGLLCRCLAAYHEVGHQRSQYRRLSLARRLQGHEALSSLHLPRDTKTQQCRQKATLSLLGRIEAEARQC